MTAPPPTMPRAVSRFDIAKDLRAAGLLPGETVIVHSSLRSIGWILGGPPEVVHAFQDVLGPTGTLLMPAFSFNLASWSMPPFDPLRTPSRVGRLAEIFRHMKAVHRSHHPTHSVAAWGARAEEFLEGPINYEPLGINSPLDRARAAGARILLIGVGQNRNSTIHLAESRAGMPYLSVPFDDTLHHEIAFYIDEPGGRPRELTIREVPGSSEGFAVLDSILQDRGILRRVAVGGADCQLMQSAALCREVESMLRRDPLLLLQGANPSEINRRRRAFMEKHHPQRGSIAG